MNKTLPVHVAVGVLRNMKGEVLVALRSKDAHQGGFWEFPGGQVEPDESVEQALKREFKEELGVSIQACTPFMQIKHDYPDKSVFLNVWNIESFSGKPIGREGQAIEWRELSKLRADDFPRANARIIRALDLPEQIVITPEIQDFAELRAIIHDSGAPIGAQKSLIYFRQKSLAAAIYLDWFSKADEQCKGSDIRLMYCPTSETINIKQLPDVQAIHLTAKQMQGIEFRPVEEHRLFSASCHNLAELKRAEALDADFAFLSPVLPTDKYAEAQLLGWAGFEELACQVNMPVYALGGMKPAYMAVSKMHQGFGIAGISCFLLT